METPCPCCSFSNSPNNSIICSNCGWLYFAFTGPFPQDLKAHFTTKSEVVLDILKKKNELRNSLGQFEIDSQILIKDLNEINNENSLLSNSKEDIRKSIESSKRSLQQIENSEEIYSRIEKLEKKLQEFRLLFHSDRPFGGSKSKTEIRFSVINGVVEVVLPSMGFEVPELVVGFSKENPINLLVDSELIVSLEKSNYLPRSLSTQKYNKLSEFSQNRYFIINFLRPNSDFYLKEI